MIRRDRGTVSLLFVLAMTIGTSLPALGATYTVGSGGQFATIQGAINDASVVDGDTLSILAGTYTEVNITVSKSLTIQGAGAASTIVQAAAAEDTATGRVFVINAGKTVTIRSMTIRYGVTTGTPARGGGIYNAGTLTISGVVLANNRAYGISSDKAEGGGLYTTGNTVIDQCTIKDNLVQGGNDMDMPGDAWGGGIFIEINRNLTMTRSTLSGNRAVGGTGDFTSGTGIGGGIAPNNGSGNGSNITLINCTLTGNAASYWGGGLYGREMFVLKHCTVANNTAANAGGGVFSCTTNDNTGPYLCHTLVADNSAPNGPDIFWNIQSRGYNLIENTSGGTMDTNGNGNTGEGNILGQDPRLSGPADNGGPTQTCALASNSPAVDQIPNGTDGLGADPLNVDQRGAPRPYGGKGDIGAYECAPMPPIVTTTVVSGVTASGADSGGNVTNDGGSPVTACGVCWNTTGTPTINDNATTDGTGTGPFMSALTGLLPVTTYYVRAYATNAVATAYGEEVSFQTAKKDQVITFGPLGARTCGDPSFGLVATASSGLAVSFTSDNTSVAAVTGTTVTIVGAGTTTITAHQGGNSTYNPAADVARTLTVNALPTPTPTPTPTPALIATPTPTPIPTPTPTPTPVITVTNPSGQAQVQNDLVQAAVKGFDPNTPVTLATPDNDTATVTIGTTGNPTLAATVEGLTPGTTLNVQADAPAGQESLAVTQPSGRHIQVVLVQFPEGTHVGLDLANAQQVVSSIAGPTGQPLAVDIQTQDTGGDITFTITYHPPKSNGLAKTLWLAPGGSMTIEATGIPADGIYRLAIACTGIPLGQSHAADLRLMKVDRTGKLSSPAGTTDRGNTPATAPLGDYGIDTTTGKVWANVNALGTFAVGVPKQPVEVVTTVTNYGCPFPAVTILALLCIAVVQLSEMRLGGHGRPSR